MGQHGYLAGTEHYVMYVWKWIDWIWYNESGQPHEDRGWDKWKFRQNRKERPWGMRKHTKTRPQNTEGKWEERRNDDGSEIKSWWWWGSALAILCCSFQGLKFHYLRPKRHHAMVQWPWPEVERGDEPAIVDAHWVNNNAASQKMSNCLQKWYLKVFNWICIHLLSLSYCLRDARSILCEYI